MSRYIDADSAKAIYLSKSAGEQLDRVPTADVEEVRHGKWEEVEGNHIFLKYKCSVCGMRAYRNDYSYCHCGAKMDIEGYENYDCENCERLCCDNCELYEGAKMDGE